jgi:hypothetical protein
VEGRQFFEVEVNRLVVGLQDFGPAAGLAIVDANVGDVVDLVETNLDRFIALDTFEGSSELADIPC